MAGKKTNKAASFWPLRAHGEAEGECKYIRLVSGEVLLLDPSSAASHDDVARELGVRDQVLSAGRVVIDRKARTVSMGERDSWTMRIKSRPGDEDAQAVQALLFPAKAKRSKRRAS